MRNLNKFGKYMAISKMKYTIFVIGQKFFIRIIDQKMRLYY
jgi:hypothetical protein